MYYDRIFDPPFMCRYLNTGLTKFKTNPTNLPGMTLSLIKFEFNLKLNSKNNILT